DNHDCDDNNAGITNTGCQPAAALDLDGVDDYVNIPNAPTLQFTSGYTLEAWINKRELGDERIVDKMNAGFADGPFTFDTDNGLRLLGGSSAGLFQVTTGTALPLNTWTHVAATVDVAAGQIKLYVNGNLAASSTISGSILNNELPVRIGSPGGGGANSGTFNGRIDEVRIWNYARSQADIQSNMNCEIQARTGLVAAYHFNQGLDSYPNPSEGILNDASGNNNNGTLTNFALTGFISNWVSPGGVVSGTTCCNMTLTTSSADSLLVCTESGQTLGNITLVATGGTEPYTFGGDPTSNLAAGDYTYTVTDATGCTATAHLNVRIGNCIIPYYEPPVTGVTDSIIGSELTQLYYYPGSLVDTTASNNIFLINDAAQEVLIEVICNVGQYDATLALLQTPEYGMHNFIDNGDSTLIITGMFPIANLTKLNVLTNLINYVRPYYTPIASNNIAVGNIGLTTSQGDKAMRADNAKTAWRLSGAGVKVGVMSDSYNTKANNPAQVDGENGDLPGSGNSAYPTPVAVSAEYPYGRASDEGRAMLQIIHDVAPGATLAFRSGFISAGNFAEGIKQLRDEGCNIIVDDITYLTEPYFTDGVVSKAVDEVTASGVQYFTSAGNFGNKSYESEFHPIPAPAGFTGMAHDFGGGVPYQTLNLVKG
ncbi:MAG TPA: hypothetical protein PKK69_05825, partial [Ferruginibacter sp.]|nr:hypothetical protein [Ferruginibacter sp.]